MNGNAQLQDSRHRLEEAVAWCRLAMPDLCLNEEPCPFAVHAALTMRSIHGRGNVRASMVREYRDRYMTRWQEAA